MGDLNSTQFNEDAINICYGTLAMLALMIQGSYASQVPDICVTIFMIRSTRYILILNFFIYFLSKKSSFLSIINLQIRKLNLRLLQKLTAINFWGI